MTQTRQNVKSMDGKKKSIGEKVVFWIGSIAAIILSFNTIYEKISEPKDAKIDISFFESNTKEIYIFPSVDTSKEQSEEIPIQLKLINNGGKIAKHLKLYISYYSTIKLETKYKKEVKRIWDSPNEEMSQVSLELDDLNPGESFLIPIGVTLNFPKEFQRTIRIPKERIRDTRFLNPMSYSLNCDISSETSNSTNSKLSILLGNLEILKSRSSRIFWIGHGNDGIKLLEVKEDFPIN
jgi:hypothetical protein